MPRPPYARIAILAPNLNPLNMPYLLDAFGVIAFLGLAILGYFLTKNRRQDLERQKEVNSSLSLIRKGLNLLKDKQKIIRSRQSSDFNIFKDLKKNQEYQNKRDLAHYDTALEEREKIRKELSTEKARITKLGKKIEEVISGYEGPSLSEKFLSQVGEKQTALYATLAAKQSGALAELTGKVDRRIGKYEEIYRSVSEKLTVLTNGMGNILPQAREISEDLAATHAQELYTYIDNKAKGLAEDIAAGFKDLELPTTQTNPDQTEEILDLKNYIQRLESTVDRLTERIEDLENRPEPEAAPDPKQEGPVKNVRNRGSAPAAKVEEKGVEELPKEIPGKREAVLPASFSRRKNFSKAK